LLRVGPRGSGEFKAISAERKQLRRLAKQVERALGQKAVDAASLNLGWSWAKLTVKFDPTAWLPTLDRVQIQAAKLTFAPSGAKELRKLLGFFGHERSAAGLEQVPLTIRSASGAHRFTVEVAHTPEEQANGLMHRQSLASDRGMIFPYEPPQDVAFWMKNTLIPLDMIFIRADGTIARIAANTVPLSLDPVPSLEPVSAVLEIAGGRAAELGIREGDRVDWPRK
jgi:hypothetical protein